MKEKGLKNRFKSGIAGVAGIFLFICLTTAPAVGADSTNPDADKILKSMSTYLAGVKTFSVTADADFEIIGLSGQKLQLSSLVTLVMERPSKFHVTRKGLLADAEFIFDGKTLTLYGKNINAYAGTSVLPGTIDSAILAYEFMTGVPAPGGDLMFADPYGVLSRGVVGSAYVGTTYVNGVECHHLAFREAEVDWQLWVKTGDEPLPMKYVISSKWITGAPQYELRLRDWNTSPTINDNRFTFVAPKGARNMAEIKVNEMGELIATEEGQK